MQTYQSAIAVDDEVGLAVAVPVEEQRHIPGQAAEHGDDVGDAVAIGVDEPDAVAVDHQVGDAVAIDVGRERDVARHAAEAHRMYATAPVCVVLTYQTPLR